MIYYENIVNVTLFFFTLPRFRKHIFSPHFRQCHCHNCYKFFFFLFRQWHCHNWVLTIFFSPYFGNAIATITLPQIFFSPNFGYGITTISLSQFFFFLFQQCHCHKSIPLFFKKWYMHTIFTTNFKCQVVIVGLKK